MYPLHKMYQEKDRIGLFSLCKIIWEDINK